MAMALQSQIKACSFVLSLALVSCLANGAISGRVGLRDRRLLLDEAAGTDFDITKNGAKADDDTFDNAQAIMHAWTSACESGSAARVVVPQGTYMTSPVVFQGPCDGPITFELQGNLKASTDVSLYADGNWVLFEYVDGLLVTGTGTFDGQGASAWKYNDCDHNSDCMALPDSIKLHQVKNSVVETVTSLNAMYFHFHVVYCTNVTLSKLTITAPSNSPNTDGIHISNSQFITVTETNIGTGDDCVSIGQGVNNLTVSQVTCGPGHGISVGSLGKYKKEKDVSGILVINCTLSNTTNGARIKSYPASPPSQASDIVFQDIIIDNVKNPIIIDQKYGSHKSDPSKVHISDVHFRNFKGSSTSNVAVNLMCSSLVPCDGVELVDIDLSYSGAGDNMTIVSSCFNAQVRTSGTQNPDPCPDSAAAPTPVSAPAPVSDLASVSSPAPSPV